MSEEAPEKPSRKKAVRKDASDRYRLVVHNYFTNGLNQKKAMVDAGYSENASPADVFNHPYVQSQMEAYRLRLERSYQLDEGWIISRLMKIADSGSILNRFKKIGSDGELYWDFTDASPDELELIQGISTDSYKEGRGKSARNIKKFTIKIPEAKAALDTLARIKGMFDDKLEVKGTVGIVERLQAGLKQVAAEKEAADAKENKNND